MKAPAPIFLTDLITELDQQLIIFLKTLSADDWKKQTLASKWKIKDVAVHLLDGNLRTLSMLRDNYYEDTTSNLDNYEDLVSYLNQLNADWVRAMKRLSPNLVVELLEQSGKAYCDYLKSLNPFDKAAFAVAWAGENESKNWFHIAREYTEKWHHQQQIRLAAGDSETLLKEKWYSPYLDTSVRALPYHYRDVPGQKNDLIQFTFRGKQDKNWFLKWENHQWELFTDVAPQKLTSEVIINNAVAWKIFTKGIDRKTAIRQSTLSGDRKLSEKIFDLIAVMA